MPSRTFLAESQWGCKDDSSTSFHPSAMIYFSSCESSKVLTVTPSHFGENTLHTAEIRPASTYILNSVLFTEYFVEPRFCKCTDFLFLFYFFYPLRAGSCLFRSLVFLIWMLPKKEKNVVSDHFFSLGITLKSPGVTINQRGLMFLKL